MLLWRVLLMALRALGQVQVAAHVALSVLIVTAVIAEIIGQI